MQQPTKSLHAKFLRRLRADFDRDMSTTLAMWIAILTALGSTAVYVWKTFSQSVTLERFFLVVLVWSVLYTGRCIAVVLRDTDRSSPKATAALMLCGSMLILLPVSLFGGLALFLLTSKAPSLKSSLALAGQGWETSAAMFVGGSGLVLNLVAGFVFIARVSFAVTRHRNFSGGVVPSTTDEAKSS